MRGLCRLTVRTHDDLGRARVGRFDRLSDQEVRETRGHRVRQMFIGTENPEGGLR